MHIKLYPVLRGGGGAKHLDPQFSHFVDPPPPPRSTNIVTGVGGGVDGGRGPYVTCGL